VETLVLEDTIEHAIFNRAKRMSRADHDVAKELEDDSSISEIIQNAQILPVDPDEETGLASFAPLHTPQQIFGRQNKHKFHRYGQIDRKMVESPQKKAKTMNSDKGSEEKNESDIRAIKSSLEPSSRNITQDDDLPVSGRIPTIFGPF